MNAREAVKPFKHIPYVGLFQYLSPSVLRQNGDSTFYLLPGHNPYVGYYNHSHKQVYIPPKKQDASTQTEPDAVQLIGQKVMDAYGDNYKVLLN